MTLCKCTLKDKRLFYQRILETKGELPPCSVVKLLLERDGLCLKDRSESLLKVLVFLRRRCKEAGTFPVM